MLVESYNLWLVSASLLIAIFASYTALDMAGRIAEDRGRSARWWIAGGSLAMGFGIWSMHFIGMLAISMPMPMGYDPLITFLSLVIGVASSAFALATVSRQKLTWKRLCSGAILMGAGVSAMHYTGMAAMRMHPAIHYVPSLFILSIAIAVGASGFALWIAFRLRNRSLKVGQLRVCAAVVMGLAIAGMHYTGMAAAQFEKNSVCAMAGSELSQTWVPPTLIFCVLAVLSIALTVSVFDFKASLLSRSLTTAREELQFLALHDNLTKLPNRALLYDRLDQEIENARRDRKPFAVLFFDLDGFKQVNDAYGHHTGDLLLVEVARRIRSVVRARDTVARLGGDEFVVLAEAAEPSDAANLANKVIRTISMPNEIGGFLCEVSASAGIALYSEQMDRVALLQRADAAMYHAKALGRNTYSFFEESINADAQDQMLVLHDLRTALTRDELVLYYQPKFDALTGALRGVEALVRWNHPQRGMLAPAEFIPLAEKFGLILPIGEWTVQEACRQMREWRDAGHGDWTVAVNFSAVQFNHPELIEMVKKGLADHELEPSCLVLEITESTAMSDPDASLSILQKLHQIGVRISIDDFGTGYSSLLYLKRLPAGELKIDRGFVRDLTLGGEDAAIISAIVALGRTLNLEIVAEGVETLEQREYLTSLGCTSLQGFLLGRPMPPDQLIRAIEEGTPVWELRGSCINGTPRLVAQIAAEVYA